MKKLILSLLVLIAGLLTLSYFLIPRKIRISGYTQLSAALPAVSRTMTDTGMWNTWIPDHQIRMKGSLFNVFNLELQAEDSFYPVRFLLVQKDLDSTLLSWETESEEVNNPFSRIINYRKALRLKKSLTRIQQNMKVYLENKLNIYGTRIQIVPVTDSILISTKKIFPQRPVAGEIDQMIKALRFYIQSNKAKEENFPMLNIRDLNEGKYEVMVAIPVNILLPETSIFAPKNMLKGGKLLETEVRGGEFKINQAFVQLETYRTDYKLLSPAIPYQLLVTDRAAVKDTSQWITRLYYPIY